MSLPFETRPDFLQPRAHDSGPMIATICGSCFGASVWVLQSFISPRLALLDSVRLKFFILLILAALSGTAAIVLTRKLSSPFSFPPSRWGRLGVTAGVFCAVVGGGTFTLIAVLNAMVAQTAAQDLSLRGQSWLVLAFCAAAFLPSVLCGFVGGLIGSSLASTNAMRKLGNKATFVVFTIEGKVKTNGVAVTLHTWNEGKMSEWKAPGTQNWWAPIRILPSAAPEKMSAIQSPQLLHFAHESAGLLVTNTPQQRLTETAPKTAAASMPLPPLISEGDVKLFLTEHHAKASRGDVSGMIADYDTIVDFLDKGRVPSTAIESEERAQRQRWPKGNEQIVSDIQVTEDSATWNAVYTMTFSNENASGEWHKGRADLKLTLRAEGTKLFITSQKARIYDVTDNKPSIPKPEPPSTPAKQVSKNVPATVPKPCFLMVWRAKEMPQVEITDYISFEGRIAWHRTYREMSPDGKVLRSCRAMYSGIRSTFIVASRRSGWLLRLA